MNLIRADKFLTDRGVTESRASAAELIRRGLVRVDGKTVAKPATMVNRNCQITVDDDAPRFVGRGALKLEHAMETFAIQCVDQTALDCGSSTGGFTECLLRRGIARVYAVDVGYGQLHWSLRQDARVIVMERTNLRTVSLDKFPEQLDLVTLDMSFISLKLVLEKVRLLLSASGRVIALIKPQFEAGRGSVGSGGVIRDAAIHRRVLKDMANWCINHGFCLSGVTASPIIGSSGNREFLFYLKPSSDTLEEKHDEWIEEALHNEQKTN